MGDYVLINLVYKCGPVRDVHIVCAKMAAHRKEVFVCGYYSWIMESNSSIEFTARYLQSILSV